MSLTKTDFKKIKDIVDTGNDLLDIKWSKRFESFESYVESRFDKTDLRLDRIEKKIEQLIRTEDEDIKVAFKEIQTLKTRLKKLESKVYSA